MDDVGLTLAILAVALVLFLSEKLRPDLIALMVVVTLGLSGVLTQPEALSGFSRDVVLTILAAFVLAEGVRRTGVADRVGQLLLRVAGRSELRLIGLVMIAGAFLSLFMNRVAALAVLLPAVSGAARKARVSPSRLMMPLAFSTLLGGMGTLFNASNVLVSGLLRQEGHDGFGILSFAPFGIPMAVIGILYMASVGRRMLPADRPAEMEDVEKDLIDTYRMGERLFRARIPEGSYLIDRPLRESTLREKFRVTVVGIEREGSIILAPPPDTLMRLDDVLLFKGNVEEFRARDVEPFLEILPTRDWHETDLESEHVVVTEAMLAPRSTLIGRTLMDIQFRTRFGFTVLAVWRAGKRLRTGLASAALEFGDALLLQGPRARLPVLAEEPDLILLEPEHEVARVPPFKARLALLIFAGTLVMAAFRPTLIAEVMLGGAVLMALARVVSMDQAYESIDWRSIFLVAGMLAMGTAMDKTGAAAILAGAVLDVVQSPTGVMAAFFMLTMLLTQAMSGPAVAAVVAPVAIQAAAGAGLDPRAMAMNVALASSMAFLTPLGHPVNVLVMGQGGYAFKDYARVGLPLVAAGLLIVVTLLMLLPVP